MYHKPLFLDLYFSLFLLIIFQKFPNLHSFISDSDITRIQNSQSNPSLDFSNGYNLNLLSAEFAFHFTDGSPLKNLLDLNIWDLY